MLVNYVINPFLVRGLDYYNNIVFEFKTKENLGSQNTFCSGGRYDNLSEIFEKNKNYPSIGASIGIDRIELILKEKIFKVKNKIAIITQSEEYNIYALNLSRELLFNKVANEIYFNKKSFKSSLRKASSEDIEFVLIIGEIEYNSKTISIKNLKTGDQFIISFYEIINFLKKNIF